MTTKEKLSAADALLCINRDQANRHPENIALDHIHSAVCDLEKRGATAPGKRAKKTAPAKAVKSAIPAPILKADNGK